MEIKESEVRCRLRVTSHQRHPFQQKQHGKETRKGSLGGGRSPKKSLEDSQELGELSCREEHSPALRETQALEDTASGRCSLREKK